MPNEHEGGVIGIRGAAKVRKAQNATEDIELLLAIDGEMP